MYTWYKSNYHTGPEKGRLEKHTVTNPSLVIISESKIERYILASLMNDKLKNLYCLLTHIRSIYSTLWFQLACNKPKERPPRRFTRGKGGQAISSMPECKPSFRGPDGGQPRKGAARVGSPCNRGSLLQVGPLLQGWYSRFFCSTCTSAQESCVPNPFWAVSSRGGSEGRFSPFELEAVW